MAGELGKRVGDRIREARLEKEARTGEKFGQRQLADAVAEITGNDAIDNQRISDWERGVHQPNDTNMRAIAKALDKPVAWFYAEKEKSPAAPNLMGVLDNGGTQLDRIESKLDLLLSLFRPDEETAEEARAALRRLREHAAGEPATETPELPARTPRRRDSPGS